MFLHDVVPNKDSRKKKKIVGRGHGSGLGKTSGKGHKGQKARSGGGVRPGFEGGQMPLQRRIPKRGFNNIFKKQIVTVNLNDLERLEGIEIVDPEILLEKRMIRKIKDGIKVLGYGNLTKKIIVKANAFSETAKARIEEAGGKAEVI